MVIINAILIYNCNSVYFLEHLLVMQKNLNCVSKLCLVKDGWSWLFTIPDGKYTDWYTG